MSIETRVEKYKHGKTIWHARYRETAEYRLNFPKLTFYDFIWSRDKDGRLDKVIGKEDTPMHDNWHLLTDSTKCRNLYNHKSKKSAEKTVQEHIDWVEEHSILNDEFWNTKTVHDNPEDGYGYFLYDSYTWCMVPRRKVGWYIGYDRGCVSYVEDLEFNAFLGEKVKPSTKETFSVSGRNISRVKKFIMSLPEYEHCKLHALDKF